MLDHEFRRYPLNLKVYAYPGSKLVIDAEGFGHQYLYESEELLEEAQKSATSKDQVEKQLSKLNDTLFVLNELEFEEYNAFLPVKMLNEARRDIVQALYDLKAGEKQKRTKEAEPKAKIAKEKRGPYLTAAVITQEQYDACKAAGIETVYFDNVIRRNQIVYEEREGELLVGGYGGIYYYKDKNPFVTDYSLNVVNATAVYELHRLGAKRVTLSYELNKGQLKDLLDTYRKENGGDPSLEMVVYGRAPLLFTKYCPMRKLNQCGICKTKQYELRDESGTFPILSHDDCTTTILNGRFLNLLDEIPGLNGVEAFRLNFTTETAADVRKVIKMAQGKLNGTWTDSVFDPKTDTRGHFNKEIV